jgi:pimeloyl-ACP methyl ester carboxylesterase
MREFWWRNGSVRLHALVSGEGKALILLHGWPGFWKDWERVLEPLSSSAMLVLPDLRGFGLSDKPGSVEDYSLDKYAGDLEALMEAMGLRKAVIGGFDVGAIVSAYFARHRPELVEGLVLMNPSYPGLGAKRLQLEQAKESWYQYFHLLEMAERLVGYNRDTVKIYLSHYFRHWSYVEDAFTEDDIEVYVDIFYRLGALRGGFNWYRSRITTRYGDWLGGPVPHRTLIVWSDRDPIFPLEWSEGAKAYFPTSELRVLKECGHFIPRERPQELAALISDFLKRL